MTTTEEHPQEPEEQRPAPRINPAGLPIGIGAGVATGAAMDNIGVGMAIGTGLGIVPSLVLGQAQGARGDDSRR